VLLRAQQLAHEITTRAARSRNCGRPRSGRELDDSAERLLEERRRLLDDMESVSRQLEAIARVEAGRFPEPGSSQAESDQLAPGLRS
jgi:hypothetical protein